MRKINRIKKVVAFFLVMILGINVQCMSGNAAGKIEKQMLSYLESVLPQYLAVDEVRVGEYKVSEPITLYNWETGESEKTLFLVFDGNEVVGQLVVQCYEGEYYSSFTTSYADVLTKVYQEKTPVAFGSYNGCFVMRTEAENILLSITDKENPLKGLEEKVQEKTSNMSGLEKIAVDDLLEVDTAVTPRVTGYNKQLFPTPVANLTINGEGVCWAACVASKTNLQKSMSLDALDVYNVLAVNPNFLPTGDVFWINLAYSRYQINTIYTDGSVGASDCYSQLCNGKPIHMSVSCDTDNDNVHDISHSILLAGVNYTDASNSSGMYKIMDPNLPDYDYVVASPSVLQNGSGFVYVTNYGYTFTRWYRTWY